MCLSPSSHVRDTLEPSNATPCVTILHDGLVLATLGEGLDCLVCHCNAGSRGRMDNSHLLLDCHLKKRRLMSSFNCWARMPAEDE